MDWHLHLGVDLILAMDHGSTDGSVEVLERYAKTHPVVWFPIPERNLDKYSPADELAAIARGTYAADWIIHCDVDEFLCTTGADLQTIFAQADRDGVTMINIPRRTMTGGPLQPGLRATQTLTLRIDQAWEATEEQNLSGDLPVPFVFLDVGGHLAVRASALDRYGHGAHAATTKWGTSAISRQLYILHYAMRGFEALCAKVENTRTFLQANPHLPPRWGWHWRRWIRLQDEGRLRADYDQQFVSPERARELVEHGVCVVDDTVARWLEQRAATRFHEVQQ